MKNRLLCISLICVILSSCMKQKSMDQILNESLRFSEAQYKLMATAMKEMPDLVPRTSDATGKLITASPNWWTSGFFPGSLWYLYEYSNDPTLKDAALMMMKRIENQKFNTGTHDLGFIFNCSYGNAHRLTSDGEYSDVLIVAAQSLSTRFRPRIGMIQSWGTMKQWQCPVIIDNMMNLELLMKVFKLTGDSSYYKIAVSHADATIKHHYRPDFSSYHVVSFDTISGQVEAKQTHQGYADESVWSRGQSWGLYGFTMMYRETKQERYLRQAEGIADFLINHPNLPHDGIPYWDYNAPDIPDAKRDASAGAIMASALIELSGYVDARKKDQYLGMAEKQLRTLSSPIYLAEPGGNGFFILKHSVGSIPAKSEVDVPLTYADYYFIEALMRFRSLLEDHSLTSE